MAQEWQLAAINPSDQTNAAITHLVNVNFSGNSFTVNVPMESVTMFVIEPAPPTVASAVVNGNNTALASAQRSMVDSIDYKFSEAVNLTNAAFTIAVHSGQSGTIPTLNWTSPDGGVTWIVTFSGSGVLGNSIADGVYDITLNSADVSAVAGGATLTANRTDTFYRLFGDLTGAKAVNTIDRIRFNAAFGSSTGASNFLAAFDLDDVGTINTIDRVVFNANSGKSLSGFTTTI